MGCGVGEENEYGPAECEEERKRDEANSWRRSLKANTVTFGLTFCPLATDADN
jgi:hypothetical protein